MRHICAFYSYGPHYIRLLKYLRAQYPEARLTALVPPSYPHEPLAPLVDDIAVTDQERYGLRTVFSLLRPIRREKYGMFVVLFDSPKLRMVGALSGARSRYCFTVDGRFTPLRLALLRTLLGRLYHHIRGRLLYARIHYVVYHHPVSTDDSASSGDRQQ